MRIRAFFASEYTWLAIYLLVVLIATGICIDRHCNNFLIFRSAFFHLREGRDLYAAYPGEHADLFKYSPTFALVFAPFALLPFTTALFLWNLLNVGLVYLGIRLVVPEPQRLAAIQLTGIGLVTIIDGTQSNGLVAGLIVLAFAALERDRLLLAATSIAGGALIKLFPLAALSFAVPRSDRTRFARRALVVGGALATLPLLVTGASGLLRQYRSWYALGAVDAADRGASVMRLAHLLFGYNGPNWPIQLAGTIALVLPVVLSWEHWRDATFRRSFLASLLVYAVIFNHKAEQPSFVIAVVGVAIWYAVSSPSAWRTVTTGAVFVATVPVFVTVVAPGLVASTIDGPLLVAAGTCVVAWLTMQGELLTGAVARMRREASVYSESSYPIPSNSTTL
jgi:hypothetical protein